MLSQIPFFSHVTEQYYPPETTATSDRYIKTTVIAWMSNGQLLLPQNLVYNIQ